MTYMMCMFMFGLVMGLVVVASNPSPYFGALGLVVVSGMGCGLLVGHGAPFFISRPVFNLFGGNAGGVCLFSSFGCWALSWDFGKSVGCFTCWYMFVGSFLGGSIFWGGWYANFWATADEFGEFSVFRGDMTGVAMMYSSGGWMLVVGAWVLLLTLFVVLELSRGLSRGALRAV
uniref:NADH-ubiquinone oxidoreductase chain 6 n=1 Tax=Eleotris fusca TaxID=86233 RepID=A0A4D6SU28_9TELE|nr:NADH dehydrogenase subunit 6 [Eleotris fusca]